MPRISLKALILSNIAHWVFFVLSMIVGMSVYLAIATIASNGQANLHELLHQKNSSSSLLMTMMVIFLFVPIPAGYTAAKIAPRDKLFNGGMATAGWIIFGIYLTIWGSPGESTVQAPQWLDFLTSWGPPIPAVFGAYLWILRDRKRAARLATAPAAPQPQPVYQPPPEAPATALARAAQAKRRTWSRGATGGLTVFLILLSHLLLTEHERDMAMLGLVIAVAALILFAFGYKMLRKPKLST